MRVVNGKQINEWDAAALAAWHGQYAEVVVDLGTGDGRFVRQLAAQNPDLGAIGVDLCAANLGAASRAVGENALFVVADALALPETLHGLATRVTVHFPWGSLLRGLLSGDAGLLDGLRALGSEETDYEIALNAGALAEAGWKFELGREQMIEHLHISGFAIDAVRLLSPADLRGMPSTWAKRLAFGRDPRAISIRTRVMGRLSPITHHPSPPSATLPRWPAWSRFCYEDVSLSAPSGPVSAQPHHGVHGASPQEGGLVARARTRAPQI